MKNKIFIIHIFAKNTFNQSNIIYENKNILYANFVEQKILMCLLINKNILFKIILIKEILSMVIYCKYF